MNDKRQWHIWQRFPTKPFRRFACTIIEDTHAGSGFDVVDLDPQVADSSFLTKLHDHMQLPTTVMSDFEDAAADDNVDATLIGVAQPKDPKHFEHAVRTIPSTDLMGARR